MAQLVEQRIRNAWVRGSSPRVGSSNLNKSQIPANRTCLRFLVMKIKRWHLILGFVAVVIIALIITVHWMWRGVVGPNFEVSEDTYIYILPTDGEEEILEKISTEGKAKSLRGWRLLRRVRPFTPHSGRYVIHPDESVLDVYRRLNQGRQEPVRLTINSVRTLDRIAGVVGTKLMLDSAAVMQALSDSAFIQDFGYNTATLPALFIPNTYEMYWDTDINAFMQRMQKENKRFWADKGRDNAAKELGLTHEEVVTLASIVDEETAQNAEKPSIAGMYLNRLHKGMMLQADPTVKFSVGDATLRRIMSTHLETESPYNTYKVKGLPPGPIRVPSVAGIDAVLHAEKNDYLYMCAKEDFSGFHNFARTYSEHQQNARRYQRALNARGIR